MRIINALVNYPVRYETLEERNYCIVPVVALVEGVHVGTGGAAFYSSVEISKYSESWNGRPVTLNHPKIKDASGEEIYIGANYPEIIKKQVVGQLFNMLAEEGKLKGEIWIDVAKANIVDAKIMQAISNQTVMEVSTGFYSDTIEGEGEWNGEKYDVTILNIRPDHIALLPGLQGACSVADGCGLRENINLINNEGKPTMKNALKKVAEFINGLMGNEVSHDDIREKLWQWCDVQNNAATSNWLEDVYDDNFIYSLVVRDPESGNRLANKLYKRTYSIDANGVVVVAADASEVVEKKEYVPVATPAANTKQEKEPIVDRKQVIDALIACNCTKFEEADREYLNGLTDNQLDKLGVKEPEKKEDPPKVNTEQPPTEPAKPVTTEAYVNSAPPEVKAMLTRALAAEKAVKDRLVKALRENKACQFSEIELNAMEIESLQKLAAIANVEIPEADYSGQTGGPKANIGIQTVPMEPAFAPKQ